MKKPIKILIPLLFLFSLFLSIIGINPTNSVVEQENALKIYLFIPLAFVGSFVVALFVNLCVDGKKLSAKYREKENQPKEVKE